MLPCFLACDGIDIGIVFFTPVDDYEATGAVNNSQQVAGFLNNYFSPSDLQTFFEWYYPKIPRDSETPAVWWGRTEPLSRGQKEASTSST